MKWVIAYDVRNDSRRRRIARRLEQVGFRRQKSVFEGDAATDEIVALLDELEAFLEGDRDALTAWPLIESGPVRLLHRGRPRDVVRRDWLVL